ncbi:MULTISPECIES: hypothetical protein [Pandoraea]|uniref:Uncharacterized protein n=2 Tax=Pandoraea TaxID=93217 RepID=A0A5E4XE53_9BURK|nr:MULTISPECIES: hypothetical protein [Pandoraea]VVE16553.1 hypothetical protein PCE31107_02925 [Pandoraea cepalis]VVE34398.1 hypothetical protein PTE31013_03846 [Pandoraea terrigena]
MFAIAPTDSPALETRSAAYPFGEKVPSTVLMLRTCVPEAPLCVEPQHYPIAYIGTRYPCFVESNGEVAVILPNGQLMHVPHDAFKVMCFHSGPTDTNRAKFFLF